MDLDLSKIFKYCPGCGAKAPKPYSREKHIICEKCGCVYYHNTAAAVGAIIESESKVLIITRANEPKAGMLDLPGGFADYGETIEEALQREVREELGVDIKELRYLTSQPNVYVFRDVEYRTIDFLFTCRIDDPAAVRYDKKEVADIRFIEPEQIPLDKLAFESVQRGLKYYISRLRKNR
jgi:NAD+ diphosphatase